MSCNKINHASRKLAKKHLKIINRKNKNKIGDVYKCPYCNMWHVTSKPKAIVRMFNHQKMRNISNPQNDS